MAEVEITNFIVVGTVNGEKEAFEFEEIAKTSVVGKRSKYLGNIARKEAESLKEIDEFLINTEKLNREKTMQTFGNTDSEKNLGNNESFFRRLISDISKAVKAK